MVLFRSLVARLARPLEESTARYFFVGGKGGVGKTTTAAALASHFSRSEKTLVVSTDPAHSLADAFNTKLSAEPRKLCPERELYGMEIDPKKTMDEIKEAMQIEKIKRVIQGGDAGFGFGMLGWADQAGLDITIFHQLLDMSPPGVDEAIAVSQLVAFEQSDYTKIVIDTAPTGHTLRLLLFPKFLLVSFPVLSLLTRMVAPGNAVSAAMARVVGADQLLRYLENTERKIKALQENMDALNKKLTDPALTEFVVVSMPNKLAVDETRRLFVSLKEQNIATNNLVVNQMPAPPVRNDVFDALDKLFKNEKDEPLKSSYKQIAEECQRQRTIYLQANKYLDDMTRNLDVNIVEIPTFATSVTGLKGLETYEKSLMREHFRQTG